MKRASNGWIRIGCAGGGTVSRKRPAGLSRNVFDSIERRFEIIEHGRSRASRSLTALGECYAARGAVQQPHAKPLLEQTDGLGKPRPRDAELGRRLGKAALGGDLRNALISAMPTPFMAASLFHYSG